MSHLQVVKSGQKTVNQKDPLYGETCLHVVLDNDLYDILFNMVEYGADFYIENVYGKNVYNLLKQRKGVLMLQPDPSRCQFPQHVMSSFFCKSYMSKFSVLAVCV